MARFRRCRRGPILIIIGVGGLFYFYSWVLGGILDDNQDWPDIAVKRREDIVTRKPDPTKPPVYFRHKEVQERCRPPSRPPKGHPPKPLRFPMDPLISQKPKIFFCPLAKAGSTFFTRYFMALRREGTMQNPYTINIGDASRQKQPTFQTIRSYSDKIQFLNDSTKVVFTRNPYSRIFSAYVDKLFSPNPYYWKVWGKQTVSISRLATDKHPCGSQVTFKDFIKTVIQILWKKDLHFIPMDAMCKFCEVGYDLVGKVEESKTDIEFLSKKINVSSSFLHDSTYKMSAIEDAVKDSTGDAISTWKKEISICMSLYDSGRIVWRKLQLRGLIDAGIGFPFSEKEMESVNLEEFRTQCFKAVNNSTDFVRLKRQKAIAYQYAYSTLTQSDVVKLQQIYKRDFLILNYDNTRPDASISGAGGLETTDPLDWRTDWKFSDD